MSKYTSLETSRKLYEAFPEWNDTHSTYKRLFKLDAKGWNDWFIADYNNGVWSGFGEISVPAYDTDYLLEKLPKKIKGDSSTGWLVVSPMDKDTWGAEYEADHTEHIDNYPFEWNDVLVEALALLALELKKEGLL